jgi:hypothetical protein
MPESIVDGDIATAVCKRPVEIVTLGREASPLVKGGSVGYDEAKDFTWLFDANFGWIASALAVYGGH